VFLAVAIRYGLVDRYGNLDETLEAELVKLELPSCFSNIIAFIYCTDRHAYMHTHVKIKAEVVASSFSFHVFFFFAQSQNNAVPSQVQRPSNVFEI
jgi:hypothetical protein